MRNIANIVLHTAASAYASVNSDPIVVHQKASVVRGYHISHNGWIDIGYHFYIEEDGRIVDGRSLATNGAHVRGNNDTTIGICVSGHGDHQHWNADQMKSVIGLCVSQCRRHNLSSDAVVGHREFPNIEKTCPGNLIDMEEIRELVKDKLKPGRKDTEVSFPAIPASAYERLISLENRVLALERQVSYIGYDGTTLIDVENFTKG